MRKFFLFFLLSSSFFFVFFLGSKFASNPSNFLVSSFSVKSPVDPQIVFASINQYRKSLNQAEFRWAENLCPLAAQRLSEIQATFSHDSFLSRKYTVFSFCSSCYRVGENLAKGFFDESALVQAWINSPTHQKNLILPYSSACIKTELTGGFAVLVVSY